MVEKTNTNTKSVISLTIGILSILIPIFGLIPGIIGVIVSRKAAMEIKQTNEDGRGLVTSGLICSSLGIIIQILAVIGLVAYYSVTTVN
ncbi:DUF4190 domain-containing protein [Ornithinibacillus scapharcae]|uniref:DUF4190 domain-containing protein n=1 Tax=Ornithinibacillus scapharcae TaxID=1147159 RepID=UPI000225B0E0|nr:DUF4190 domain-containing protein [Ornithinibacillus scapharcae]